MNGVDGFEITLNADAVSIIITPSKSFFERDGRFCTDFADRLNFKSLSEVWDRWHNGSTERCQHIH